MINKALKLIRKYHNHTLEQTASMVGSGKSHISQVENGLRNPSLGLLESYANAYDMPLSSLLFFAENQGNSERTEKLRKSIAGKAIKLLEWLEDIS